MASKYGMFSKILFVVILLAVSVEGYAQAMTDNQVIQFVQQEQQKGSDQQTIVTKLFQKGVTAEQLRRIRKKYEAQKTQLGAVDLQEQSATPNNTANRMRTNKEKALEKQNQKNGFMIRSQREEMEEKLKTRTDRQNDLNDEIEFMDIDSLIYYQNYFRDENQVFGRNIFNNKLLTFEPNQNMATPANYCLGAGDLVVIDVWGASQQTFEGTISPDGVVVVDGVGPIKLAGQTVKQATQTVKSRLSKYYSDCSFSLSVGDTRSIQVQVVGDVVMPGTYTLSSLSSAFNALYAAGGINDVGTLRDIKVYRSGRQIATIDVYDYLLNGNQNGDIRLQDNDIVQVGPYECLVDVRGKVKRPMFYEMKRTESAATLLRYAGGFTGDAYTKAIRINRKAGQQYSVFSVGEFDMNDFKLMDEDSVSVDSTLNRYQNMVEIKGAVFRPGMYQVGGQITTVKALVEAADGLTENAIGNHAVMHRMKADRTLKIQSIDIVGILEGTVADMELKNEDVIYIASREEEKLDQTITIHGEVNYPGVYRFASNETIEDLVLQAGGLTNAASLAKVDVSRRIIDPNATAASDTLAFTYSFSLNPDFTIPQGENQFVLQPYDEVYIRRSPKYVEQQNVTIDGEVQFQGNYTLTHNSQRLSDIVRQAGGLTKRAYPEGAKLLRQMTDEERDLMETMLRTAQRNSGSDSIDVKKLLTLTTFPVAIELDKALANPGSDDDPILREGDRIVVPRYTSTVSINGEVLYPNTVRFKEGKDAEYYINLAGGATSTGKKSKTIIIYMNGMVAKADRKHKPAPGCQIVVPTKRRARQMGIAEWLTIGSSTASIATMIATIANLVK